MQRCGRSDNNDGEQQEKTKRTIIMVKTRDLKRIPNYRHQWQNIPRTVPPDWTIIRLSFLGMILSQSWTFRICLPAHKTIRTESKINLNSIQLTQLATFGQVSYKSGPPDKNDSIRVVISHSMLPISIRPKSWFGTTGPDKHVTTPHK